MNRTPIAKFVDADNQYDFYGARTPFRLLVGQLIPKVLKEGKWFGFYNKTAEKQVNLMSIKNSEDVKIGTMVAEIYPNTLYRTAIYKYLLRDYLCYYEAPSGKRGYGNYTSYYDKFIATSSIEVVAKWLDISLDEAKMQYGSRLNEVDIDTEDGLFQYVKLYETKEGVRKVTKPRSDIDLGKSGIRITPIFALKEGVDYLYTLASEKSYEVTFMKDGGAERNMVITFNPDIIKEIYGDTDFAQDGINSQYNGDFFNNSSLSRGFIRVFELGASMYDRPLRSINYARIVSFREKEPDLTYINIDLDSVLETFIDATRTSSLNVKELINNLELFEVGTERTIKGAEIKNFLEIEEWAQQQYTLLGTVFLRQLALFMLGNPLMFKGYTGQPREVVVSDVAESFEDFDSLLDME